MLLRVRSHAHLAELITGALLLGALAGGCAPKYYATNTHNVPLLQKQGDGHVALAAGDGRVEAQGAYAVTNAFAVQINTAFLQERNDSDADNGKGHLIEVGAGYYGMLSRTFVFETYGLAAIGQVENHFPSTVAAFPGTTGDIHAKLFRYGIQSALGFRSTYFEAALSARIGGLNFYDIDGSLFFSGENQVNYLRINNSHFLLEPALTIRGCYDVVKLQLQLGGSLNLTTRDFRQEEAYVTIGFIYIWTL